MDRLTPRGRRQALLAAALSLLVPAGIVGCVVSWYTSPDCGWAFCVEPQMREIAEQARVPRSATELWSQLDGTEHDGSVFTVAYRVREANDEVRPSADWRWVDDPDADWGSGSRSGDCAVSIDRPGDDGYVAPGRREQMRVPDHTFVVWVTRPWSVQ